LTSSTFSTDRFNRKIKNKALVEPSTVLKRKDRNTVKGQKQTIWDGRSGILARISGTEVQTSVTLMTSLVGVNVSYVR
jgi:hypothetical protein